MSGGSCGRLHSVKAQSVPKSPPCLPRFQNLFQNFLPKPAVLTPSIFRHNVSPPNSKFSPNAQSLLSAACSQSTSHHLTGFTSQICTLPPAYLYQKDERALPGNLQSSKLVFPPLTTPPSSLRTNCLLDFVHRPDEILKYIKSRRFGG